MALMHWRNFLLVTACDWMVVDIDRGDSRSEGSKDRANEPALTVAGWWDC